MNYVFMIFAIVMFGLLCLGFVLSGVDAIRRDRLMTKIETLHKMGYVYDSGLGYPIVNWRRYEDSCWPVMGQRRSHGYWISPEKDKIVTEGAMKMMSRRKLMKYIGLMD